MAQNSSDVSFASLGDGPEITDIAGWPLPDDMDDSQLEAWLYIQGEPPTAVRPLPDWATIHQELRRKGVTLQPRLGMTATP
jgi:hypothetical protein